MRWRVEGHGVEKRKKTKEGMVVEELVEEFNNMYEKEEQEKSMG